MYKMASLRIKLVLISLLCLTVTDLTDCAQCKRLSSCSCECPDGIVELEPLSGKNGEPR